MTTVRIKQVVDGAGNIVPAKVDVRLVDADGVYRIGWIAATGQPITEYQRLQLDADSGDLLLPLTPTPEIAIDESGSPTWYRVEISARHRSEGVLVQVPDSGTEVDLMTLIGVETMDGGSMLYGYLLTTDERSAMDAASDPNGSNAIATLADIVGGIPGASPTISATAGQDLSGQRAVIIADGIATYADGDTQAHAGQVAGITTGAALDGAAIAIQTIGEMNEPGWAWARGPVWLGSNGALTQTPPASGISQILAIALNATQIIIRLHIPFVRA